jgi:hypothetical protein
MDRKEQRPGAILTEDASWKQKHTGHLTSFAFTVTTLNDQCIIHKSYFFQNQKHAAPVFLMNSTKHNYDLAKRIIFDSKPFPHFTEDLFENS